MDEFILCFGSRFRDGVDGRLRGATRPHFKHAVCPTLFSNVHTQVQVLTAISIALGPSLVKFDRDGVVTIGGSGGLARPLSLPYPPCIGLPLSHLLSKARISASSNWSRASLRRLSGSCPPVELPPLGVDGVAVDVPCFDRMGESVDGRSHSDPDLRSSCPDLALGVFEESPGSAE